MNEPLTKFGVVCRDAQNAKHFEAVLTQLRRLRSWQNVKTVGWLVVVARGLYLARDLFTLWIKMRSWKLQKFLSCFLHNSAMESWPKFSYGGGMTRGASAICTLVSAYTFSLFFAQQILIKVSCSGIVINKTISDGGITVDFSIIKVHTSYWSSNSWGSSNTWGSSNSSCWDHRIVGDHRIPLDL